VKHAVNYSDLDKTQLFKSHAAIESFLAYYKTFDFLEVENISKFGKKATSMEESVAQVSVCYIWSGDKKTQDVIIWLESGQRETRPYIDWEGEQKERV
jgi:hypothetical protein